jgi:hypothetical protein
MADHSYEDASLPTLFWLWAKYKIAQRLKAMRPALKSNEVARETALSGNPPGA